jgi:SOS-response transcriptional repressor LexA
VLSFVAQFIEEHGYSPSTREIAAACGHVSTNSANLMLHTLAREGFILMPPHGVARGIVLVDAAAKATENRERIELRNIRSSLDKLLSHDFSITEFANALHESFARCGL